MLKRSNTVLEVSSSGLKNPPGGEIWVDDNKEIKICDFTGQRFFSILRVESFLQWFVSGANSKDKSQMSTYTAFFFCHDVISISTSRRKNIHDFRRHTHLAKPCVKQLAFNVGKIYVSCSVDFIKLRFHGVQCRGSVAWCFQGHKRTAWFVASLWWRWPL